MSSEQYHNSGHTEQTPAVSKTRVGIFILVALIVAVILAIVGILTRVHAQKQLVQDTHEMAVPEVLVIDPKEGAPAQEIVLPGNMQAYTDAPIYARTSGYLKKWYVDIGGRVKKGQVLAVIDSPEVDQQLQQGRADLATAQSNLQISQTTAARYTDLLKTNSVSRQDQESFAADAQSKQTMVRSAEANVKRLEELQSFEKITAPFDGVITARNTDNGQLINAGNASTATTAAPGQSSNGRELFHIAAINTLRVFINVPQVYSRDAKPSTTADLTLAQFPGRKFPGKLVRNANAIDLATRTLLVEIDVNNADGELLPGSYAEVHLKLETGMPTIILPVSALIFRTQGLQVATLEGNDHARLTPIVMGRDFGTQVEVVSGLKVGQRVIDSPPDSLVDQQPVRIIQSKHDTAQRTVK
ncbi:efflux RND transporter periplasmic adaptor subunit [Granulicella arctica]|uniref:RND family efflux transporter MFP subunit n=1 Tax=Granulicella arctica TaxID=940613 RepID=A0A7Y9PJT8_9BACT|nr:efflux RND transporter periplasmic adaptor subunit [Granulicella arctica]NYF80466.1 RND family efflux transporter MFP subunit [Granulicella arctica]